MERTLNKIIHTLMAATKYYTLIGDTRKLKMFKLTKDNNRNKQQQQQ